MVEIYLGTVGIRRYAWEHPEVGIDTPLDVAHQVFKILAGRMELPGTINQHLRLAQILALLLMGAATVKAVLLFLKVEIDKFRLGFWTDHTVICGFSDEGRRLAEVLMEGGQRVVLLENRGGREPGPSFHRRRAISLLGDLQDPALLRQAGITRASEVFITTGADEANLALGVIAHDLAVAERPGGRAPLRLQVSIDNPWLHRYFEHHPILSTPNRQVEPHITSIHERSATAVLRECPPDARDDEGRTYARVLLVGFNAMGQALLLECLKQMHVPKDGACSITVVPQDPSQEQAFHRFLSEFRLEQDRPERPPFPALNLKPLAAGQPLPLEDCTAVYLSLTQDTDSLSLAEQIQASITTATRIAVCSQNVHISRLAADVEAGRRNSIRLFNVLDLGCMEARDTLPGLERLAQAIHARWIKAQTGLQTRNPNLRPWTELPERSREANRQQATQIHVKLRSLGAHLVSSGEPGEPLRLEAVPELVEALAEAEHRRWMAEKWLGGWSYAAVRDNVRLHHPCLKPWSQLTEAERDMDRATILDLPALADFMGQEIRLVPL